MKKQNKVAFFNILSVILLRGISIFTAPIFSRMLGTDGYGVVSVYTIWVGALAIVFTLQTQGTMPTARVEYSDEKFRQYQSSALFLSMVAFAVLGGAVMLFCRPIARMLKLDTVLIPLILIHAFASFCVQFLNTKFVYEYRADINCILSVTVAVLTVGLSVLFITLLPEQYDYYGRILALVVTYGTVGFGACIYVLKSGKVFYNREFWHFCLPLALPFVFYNLSDLLLGQSDRVMLNDMMDASSVGLYSLALNFGGIMFTIFGALNTSWCPFFFDDMKYGRRDSIDRQAKNFTELYTVLSAGFLLLTPEVFHIFAREDFWGGIPWIPIFVSSYYLNFLCTFPVNYEYYQKKTKAVAIVTIAASVVNIGLNYVLIRRLGVMGAALATCISHGLQFGLHYFYAKYRLSGGDYPFGFRKWAVPAGFYCGVVALVYLLPEAGLLRWGLGAAIGVWELLQIRRRKSLF